MALYFLISVYSHHAQSLWKFEISVQAVSDLADKAKEHGSNLVNSAKDSFSDLTDKLNEHIDTLKGHASTIGDHASNALDALKEAASAIACE